ncbi:uncharacterized protein LOC127843681 [Dreissena polymorpha]|uniref:uncharacterized protein LOC127843681 n=1 Tax=Dreissena polymorpha TaxID=45954 RepID=UPI00226459AA|nr:uncharacterized protein LOC127843681 [Dreissena polymorpha]
MSSTHNDNLAFIQCEKVREIVTRAQLHIQKMVRREGKISNFKGNNHIIQMLSGKEKFGESFVTGYYASSVCMKEDHSVHVADDKKTCLINAISELNNSQIAITDFNNNRLKLLDAVFEIVCVFDLPCAPNDVCRINNNSIAVALNNNTLLVFNVIESGFKLIRQIKFPFSCNAVACHKDNLYIAADTDLYTSTVKGHNRKRINNTTLEPGSVNFCKVSNDGGHIYITGNNEIVIADISSHSFDRIDKHPGMKDSRGMHITECGNVLVCDQGRQRVFIMEGKRLSSFIDSLEYCPPMPIAVCYTRHNPCLIIGHQDRNTITVLRLNISI